MQNRLSTRVSALVLAFLITLQTIAPTFVYAVDATTDVVPAQTEVLVDSEAPSETQTEIIVDEGTEESTEAVTEAVTEEVKHTLSFASPALTYKTPEQFYEELTIAETIGEEVRTYFYEEALAAGIKVTTTTYADRVELTLEKEGYEAVTSTFQKEQPKFPEKLAQEDRGNTGVIKASLTHFTYTNEEQAKLHETQTGFYSDLKLSLRFEEGMQVGDAFTLTLPKEVQTTVKDGYLGMVEDLAEVTVEKGVVTFAVLKDIPKEILVDTQLRGEGNTPLITPVLTAWGDGTELIEKALLFVSEYKEEKTEIQEQQALYVSPDYQLENRIFTEQNTQTGYTVVVQEPGTITQDFQTKEATVELDEVLSIYTVETFAGLPIESTMEKVWPVENSTVSVMRTPTGFEVTSEQPLLIVVQSDEGQATTTMNSDVVSNDELHPITSEELTSTFTIGLSVIEKPVDEVTEEATEETTETETATTENVDASEGKETSAGTTESAATETSSTRISELTEQTTTDEPTLEDFTPDTFSLLNTFTSVVEMQSLRMTAFAAQSDLVPASGNDVKALVVATPTGIGANRSYYPIEINVNSSKDTFVLNVDYAFNNLIEPGDWFEVVIPDVLRPESILSGGLLDITDTEGNVIAQAQSDGNRTIKYVFTSYMDNYSDVRGTLRQPFNLNPDNMGDGYRSFQIAGKSYYDYYRIFPNEYSSSTYANFKSAIVDVDREAGTFTQYIQVNPRSYSLYNATLTIQETTGLTPGNSAILDDSTTVELLRYTGSYPTDLSLYDPIDLIPETGARVTKSADRISLYFGNNLVSSTYPYYYNKYVVKITGRLDASGNPIGTTSKLTGNTGQYTVTGTHNTYYSNVLGTSDFTGTLDFVPVDFTIHKVNENKEPVSGATFKITGDNGYNETIEGSNLSTFVFEGLPQGNYKIEEIATPSGYVDPVTSWTFSIEKDDTGKAIIKSPDFPMEVSTNENTEIKGTYPDPYDSQYTDLVRNPVDYQVNFPPTSIDPVGTVSKRIIGKTGTNSYEVEVMVRINPYKSFTSGRLTDQMAAEFNVELGEDGGFAREDFSLTASDGSFLYIEQPGMASGVYGGDPFSTQKVLSGADIAYNETDDAIIVNNINVSSKPTEQWIKMTYTLTVDTDLDYLDQYTFYPINGNTVIISSAGSMSLPNPSVRPVVINHQDTMEVTVINVKENADFIVKKVGIERTYDETGNPIDTEVGLQGAQFELLQSIEMDGSDAKSTNQSIISNYEGMVSFENLQRSFYYSETNNSTSYYWLKEVAAPTGYELIKDRIGPFRINYDGTIDYLGSDTTMVKPPAEGELSYHYSITNDKERYTGEFDLYKKAADNVIDGEPQPLPGSEFTLYWVGTNLDNFWTATEVSQTLVTDDQGKIFFGELAEGYYRLEETKPVDGYIKSSIVYQVYVNANGITSLTQRADKPAENAANFADEFSMMRSMSLSGAMFTPFAAADTGGVQEIPAEDMPGLYPEITKDYTYTEPISNNTGFTEKYINPTDTTGLYSFDGTFRNESLEGVASLNKYIVPTGVPGEYQVHVRVEGNRTESNLGVVVVYDNSNSMADNDRVTKAREATSNFLQKLLSPGDESTQAALVTYGSTLFNTTRQNYSHEAFTTNAEDIINKLPTNTPTDRGYGNEGGTYTQGAIERAQQLLAAQDFDNKVIITISDGVPTFSQVVQYIDANGDYVYRGQKTGTGNRFIQPLTTESRWGRTTYSDYYVVDKTTTYDYRAPYASYSTAIKRYYTEAGAYDTTNNRLPEPPGGYGYKLITNHGYATIDKAKQIKNNGTLMYTIGIQIDKSNISGTSTTDATRDQALEVMFGLSTSKDTYFDAQNLAHLDVYLNQILAELADQNPPTVNRGILIDPMGEMVVLKEDMGISIRDVGSRRIPIDSLDGITKTVEEMTYTKGDGTTVNTNGIRLDNVNLSRGQEIEMVYTIGLDTDDPAYAKDVLYETNGTTTLQPNANYNTLWEFPIPKISGPDLDMELQKVWQTPTGEPGEDAGPVQVQLQRKIVGQTASDYVDVPDSLLEVSDANAWKVQFNDLVPFDSDGNVYEYRIIEIGGDGKYTILYEGNGFYRTIINRERVIVDYVNDINEIVFTKKDAVDNTILKNILFHLEKDGEFYESQRTDTNGQVTFSKLPPGSYKLIEVDTPLGYETPENPVRTFTVGSDGVITYTGTEDAFKTILNTPIQVPVTMVKVDGDTESPLSGAVFNLYAEDQTTNLGEFTSDENGVIDFGILRVGTYFLKEKTPPPATDGEYQPITDFMELIVQQDGQINFRSEAKPSTDPHQIMNYKEVLTQIAIRKVKTNPTETDPNAVDSISGATFKLTKLENGIDTDVAVPTSTGQDTEGFVFGTFSQLNEGIYRLREQRVPIGYIRDAGYFTFGIEATTDTETGQTTNTITWIRRHDILVDENGNFTPSGDEYIYKHDEHGILIYGDDNPNDTEVVDTAYASKYFREITPIDGDQAVKILGLEVVNDPNVIKLEKIDGQTKEKLAGVSFGLYYEVTENPEETGFVQGGTDEIMVRRVIENKLLDSTYPPEDNTVVVRTTDENGVVSFRGLPQSAPGMESIVFYIKEMAPPDGYQLSPYFIGPFTATQDGIKDKDGNYIRTTGALLNPDGVTFTDPDYKYPIENYIKPELSIKKVDGTDENILLAGAEFELYQSEQNADGTYQGKKQSQPTGITAVSGDGITDADGVLHELGVASFGNLDDGLYWVKETRAPDGYSLVLDYIGPYFIEKGIIYKLTLDESGNIQYGEDGKILESSKIQLNTIEGTTDTYRDTVENMKGLYPSTGGIGTLTFTFVGAILMGGSILIEKKRRKKRQFSPKSGA